jgi:hypothetical protein
VQTKLIYSQRAGREDFENKQSELILVRLQNSAYSDFLRALIKSVAYRISGEEGFGVFKRESDTQPFEQCWSGGLLHT